jgi:mannose-6-phosphate isomerase
MAHGLTRLEPSFRERIWGTTKLAPWFPDPASKTGEVWFLGGDDASLLVKFIFTSANLSVQVHPDNEFARRHENCRGKTEMWHILQAEPGAGLALGFRENIDREEFEKALKLGRVEDLLKWVPALPGDTFFVPAGTVHAIGAGLTLCEIQQNSDITYRLYDYGRPRELHLERGLAVSRFEPYDGKVALPFHCPHFRADLIPISGSRDLDGGPGRERMWIVLEGKGELNGQPYRSGEAWRLDDDCPPVHVEPAEPTRFLTTAN